MTIQKIIYLIVKTWMYISLVMTNCLVKKLNHMTEEYKEIRSYKPLTE